MPAVLIVVGGLPATGKSTICRELSRTTRSPWLRVDRIEDAVVRSTTLEHPVGAVGYTVAYALAGELLSCGVDVIAECVNPLPVTRTAWRRVSIDAGARMVEVEVVCSDPVEHRRRAASRTVDIAGHRLPTWDQIHKREYALWDADHVMIDTAETTADEAVGALARLAWPQRD